MIWRLSKQKWANRGNQTSDQSGSQLIVSLRNGMAVYLTALSVGALFLSVMVYTNLVEIPSWGFVISMF